MSDASIDPLKAISQAVLLHNATVCGCDAILQAAGLRVTPGDRSGVVGKRSTVARPAPSVRTSIEVAPRPIGTAPAR